MRQHSAHTPSLRSSAPRESSLERVRRIAREHEKPFDPSKRGTWRGSSRDLVVNPAKRFKQAREGRVDRDSDTPEDEFLVIEEDRGNGTLEWVLVNPLDYPGGQRAAGKSLYAFGFGAYGSTRLLVWGTNDLDAALEEAAEWLEKYAPGHLSTEDHVTQLMDEVREENPDLEDEEAYEKATADLTYTEAGYLTSYEWTVDDVAPRSDLYNLAEEASREEYEREYGEESLRPNVGRGMGKKYFARCNDITPSRCTLLEIHPTRTSAEAEADQDAEQGIFELDSVAYSPGERLYHLDGRAWGK